MNIVRTVKWNSPYTSFYKYVFIRICKDDGGGGGGGEKVEGGGG